MITQAARSGSMLKADRPPGVLPRTSRMPARRTNGIRKAEIADAPQITSLINAAFRIAEEFFVDGNRITLLEVEQLFDSGVFLVRGEGATLDACIYVERRGDRSYFGLLSVDPSLQKSGLGSILINAAEAYAKEGGARFMDILTVNVREELPDFYGKRGYEVTGTSPLPDGLETKLPCHFVNMSKAL
jgi:GNAT superfamily N-acetyltransferase